MSQLDQIFLLNTWHRFYGYSLIATYQKCLLIFLMICWLQWYEETFGWIDLIYQHKIVDEVVLPFSVFRPVWSVKEA